MNQKIAILFQNPTAEGKILVYHGSLTGLNINPGKTGENGTFSSANRTSSRLTLTVGDVRNEAGAFATRIYVKTAEFGFSFFLRDVNRDFPIYIPQYGVVVTDADDRRSFDLVAGSIKTKGGQSELQKIAAAPEESFEHCIAGLRELQSPTWLGISRDIRIFEVGIRDYCAETWDCVSPKFFSIPEKSPELGDGPVKYCFMAGRGIGCEKNLERKLEDGVLPILNATSRDGDVVYQTRYFVTQEASPLDPEHVRGTDMYVADVHGAGHMLTPEQQKHTDLLLEQEIHRDEETVMYIRINVVNTGAVPRYSFVRIPDPLSFREYAGYQFELPHYDGETGYGVLSNDKVFMIATLDGSPVPQEEMSVLILPGEQKTYLFKIPHAPISKARAEALAAQDAERRFAECKRFWQSKLIDAARISVPETRINDMIRAGLLHMDLAYFGLEPDKPVVPIVGVYTAIGSESSPGIQFLDAMNKCQLAERALQYFVEKQHDDGFIQNFGGYMLETGFALWSMGEHYRYGAGVKWAESVADCVKKACEYTIRWRESSLDESLRLKGYGMIDGKVADPNDLFHSFMLNSGAYAGFVAAADILEKVDPKASVKYRLIAETLKTDIRASLFESMAQSPVIPLGNGCWIPGCAPWTEYPGPLSLYAEGGKWYSHATSTIRDILGVQYLILHGVVNPHEQAADFIANYFAEFLCQRNVAFSQPYYSPHSYNNLCRGEVKAFLSEFYNGFAALADRNTYSFWEHFFHASPHKLHEETWFLMRCRWMLYLEDGQTLKLLPGVPRGWLKDGQSISAEGVRTCFGRLSFHVESQLAAGRIRVSVHMEGDHLPEKLLVRIPHPCEGARATAVSAGQYDEKTETVKVTPFKGDASFEVIF
ncbi:MAG: hypothetical protein VB070_08710 [Clostridiaceae bacterium]|nr:hypothetical protein [Clostridiaceae bacterium]